MHVAGVRVPFLHPAPAGFFSRDGAMRRGDIDDARGRIRAQRYRDATQVPRDPSFAAAFHRRIAAVRRVGVARCATGAQIRAMELRRSARANA
jgi:hypothetical protein